MRPPPTRFAHLAGRADPGGADPSAGANDVPFVSGLSPLRGGAASGPAKPVPRRPLDVAAGCRGGLLVGLWLAAVVACAETPQPATRAEVAVQRAAIEQRFAQEKLDCEQRFSVAACLDELRRRRHEALAPLVRRENELAAEERRARAAAQTQRVRERELAASQDEGQKRERILTAPPPAPPAVAASRTPRARSPEDAARQRQQAENKAQGEAAKRREQAEVREKRQQQRIAEHEARQKARAKPLAAPLPLPGASAASR